MFMFLEGFSQNNGSITGGWRFTGISGEVKLKGLYSERYTTLKDLYEYHKNSNISGGVKLNTRSYIWHPNFLLMEIGGEYSPEANQDNYLVSPDHSNVRTLKGANLGVTFFNSKPVTLSSWINTNESYFNRENLTSIKSKTRRFGSSFTLQSDFLPLNINYNNTKWDQLEVQTGRTFKTEQSNIEASTHKEFTSRDKTFISFSHIDYLRLGADNSSAANITDNIRVNSSIYLDKNKRHTLLSMINNYNRKGYQAFRNFNITENLILNFPGNFKFTGVYNLYNQQHEIQKSLIKKTSLNLNHQLFSSLYTNLNYEYSSVDHTLFLEKRNRIGGTVNYRKKIPSGHINLAYSYSSLRTDMDSEPVDLPVINEDYYLTDGVITILNKPYIDIKTIVVKDITGSVIYQRDFDYFLIENDIYIEIQRIPGGQIANNSSVYIDYIAVQEGSYEYNAISNNFSGNITLLNRLLELYFRSHNIDYTNIEMSDLLKLNYIEQNTFGGKINVAFAEVGAEFDDHNSTITPYKLMRYYANIHKRFNKVILTLNGNIRDYNLVEDNIKRKYSDISASTTYEFIPGTKLHLNLGYRKQRESGMDLDLLTATTEFKTSYRNLYLNLGVKLYHRNYLNDKTNFISTYMELARRF